MNNKENKTQNIYVYIKFTLTVQDKSILRDIKQTRDFLKQNPEIIVLNADKGNVTVLMEKTDYLEKMSSLLNDTTTYQQLSKHNTIALQKEANNFFDEWVKESRIDEIYAKNLKTHNGFVAKLYGLVKIHKNNSIRPILSCIGSPLYNLAKFLSNIFKPSVGLKDSHIKNSTEFVEKIKNIKLPPGYILISLDVTSLFTNIDTKLILKLVEKNWKTLKKNAKTKIRKDQFLAALQLVLSNNEFIFDDKIFRQIFGLPMGSPISAILADFVMEYIEEQAINKLEFNLLF